VTLVPETADLPSPAGPPPAVSPPAPPPTPTTRPARGSSESFGLLRAALIVALFLGVPTYLALLYAHPQDPWRAAARLEVKGDTWDGNLVADGDRVYLMTRELITGFWGVLSVRSSADGGRTWGDPVQVSAAGGPSAARHTLTLGQDGASGPRGRRSARLRRRSSWSCAAHVTRAERGKHRSGPLARRSAWWAFPRS